MREIHHGRRLPVNMGVREQVETHGWAPQCRATSEVPPGPDKALGLGSQAAGFKPGLTFLLCVTLGKVLPLSGFSFLICKVGT